MISSGPVGIYKAVSDLPHLEISGLTTKYMQQRVYSLLSFISHGYVWQYKDTPAQPLPSQIYKPWITFAALLGTNPVATYASVVLYNWKLKNPASLVTLENIESVTRFTNYTDEDWFYRVHIMMEYMGSVAVKECLKLLEITAAPIHATTAQNMIESLKILQDCIKEIIKTISRMGECCDPKNFITNCGHISVDGQTSRNFRTVYPMAKSVILSI